MSRSTRYLAAVAALLAWSAAGGPSPAAMQDRHGPSWHDVKCARYTKAWSAALARQGSEGLGRAFLASHAAFLASNCTRHADVCARSAAELKLANTMVILSMNAGTASTFPPFYCRE
jgi:hypothetical protein